jgi:hypothetical protein
VKPSDPGLFPFFIDLIDSPHSLNDQFPSKMSNWRPISLLNTDSKIASAAIANRFKQVLGCIISNTQKGFYERQIHG